MKTCTKCKVEKDETLFSKNIGRKDGLNSCCKKCDNERRGNNKEKRKEWYAKYKESNKDKIKERGAKYRENNKEKIKESNAKCKAKHRERINEYSAKYHARNKDKLHAYKKEQAKSLVDSYVIKLIRHGTSLEANDIPKGLIEAKRMQMMINRKLREMRE